MTTLTELEALAKAAIIEMGGVALAKRDMKCDPEDILALIKLCRMQNWALLEYPVTHDAVIEALAAFEFFKGE